MSRRFLLKSLVCALPLVCAGNALAADYPSRPVRLVAPFAPGGALDLIARSVAQSLTEQWKQTVFVDNKAGAAGVIGTETVARATPDGYTILLGVTTTHGTNPSLYTKLPYDPVKDFAPISLIATIPHVLVVTPSMPVKTLDEFLRYAKSKPGLNYGSVGKGSPHHLAMEMFKEKTKIDAQHVPYKGTGPAMTAVMSGELDFMFVEITGAAPHIESGRLKPIGIAASKRVSGLNIPTFAEGGMPDFEITSWYAMFAPAGTPPQIVDKINKGIVDALKSDEVRTKLSTLGAQPVGSTPEELGRYVKDQIALWAHAVKTSGVKLE